MGYEDLANINRVIEFIYEYKNKGLKESGRLNITDIREPGKAALDGGADGLVAINTILSLSNIDMKTFKPNLIFF